MPILRAVPSPARASVAAATSADPLAARRDADLRLARRCTRGERDAERELFEAHRERVHVILFRILGSNRELDDLIQDAFLEIFRSLASYRGDAHLGTWIDRITTRVAWRHISQRKPPPTLLQLAPVTDESLSPERRVVVRQAARRLYAILDTLEAAQRIAFTLHVVDGRPLKEVASLTGSTLVATKIRVWRARRVVAARARTDEGLAMFVHGGGRP